MSDDRQGIGSVEVAARILVALEEARGPLALHELAARCDASPSKVHRYLVSLGRAGLTAQSPDSGRYDLGPASRRLGAEALRRTNEVAVVSHHAWILSESTGFAVNVSVWSDDGPVIVRWDYGAQALSLVARVGATLPIARSAAGQVFLAFLPPALAAAARARASLEVDERSVERLISAAQATGVGVSDGGVVSDAYSIAAPVFTAADPLPLVISVALRRNLAADEARDLARERLLAAASAATHELGGAPST